MVEEVEVGDPQERFQNFFKTEDYRQRLAQMAMTGKTSLTVNFEDILAFDQALAEELLVKPDEYLKHANNAAYAQLQIEDPEYAEKTGLVDVRIVRLLQPAPSAQARFRTYRQVCHGGRHRCPFIPCAPNGYASSFQMQKLRNDNARQSDRLLHEGAIRVQRPELQKQRALRICSRRFNLHRFPRFADSGET